MREACLALDYPVVSGNVSLYNETNGSGILPTPAIGGVGLIEDAAKSVSLGFKREGDIIVVIGETKGWLGQSLYLRELLAREDGAPPPVDLKAERRNGDFVRAQIRAGAVSACHDVSDGGLLVALTEMAMASGIGATLSAPQDRPAHAFWFGEDQARYVLTCRSADALLQAAQKADVPARVVGKTGGAALTLAGGNAISVAELKRLNEAWLPAYMAQ